MENSTSHDNSPSSKRTNPDDFSQKLNYTLYDIANSINKTGTLKNLYHSIYRSLNKLIELPNFFIAHYDEHTRMIDFEYFIDEYDEDFPIIENDTGPNSLTGEVIKAKRPLLLKENILMERKKSNRLVGTTPKIWLGAPLIIQDHIVGVISIQHYTNPDYFSHKHLEILVCISELVSMAIERKQFLGNIEKEKEILQTIADQTHSIVFIINSEGTYEFANPSHIKLGYAPDDMISTSFLDLVHPDNIQDILEFLEKGILGRIFQTSLAFKIKTKTGIYHTVDGIFNIIRNNESILEKIIFVGRIIQGQKDKASTDRPLLPDEKKSASISNTSIPRQAESILIIEDDETVRSVTAKALKTLGYNPVEAHDGERGLDIYKTSHHSINAILLDIILPGISGVDTFKKILEINPVAKIIITSGHVTSEDQQKIFSTATAFIEKPYGIMTIRETFNKIFKKKDANYLIPF